MWPNRYFFHKPLTVHTAVRTITAPSDIGWSWPLLFSGRSFAGSLGAAIGSGNGHLQDRRLRFRMATNSKQVPEVVVLRLPLYVRALTQMQDDGTTVISSQQLGSRLQMTPAQIRKDLSYFGRFGKQGRGYNVESLLRELGRILGLDREWPACLIGVGRLGRAIINYPGFAPEGFHIVAAFDGDLDQVGMDVGGLTVMPMDRLRGTLRSEKIAIAIVAVPADEAQAVIDALVECDVKGILNYAPVAPKVPMSVVLRNIDPVLSLQSMTYYLLDSLDSSEGDGRS